MLITTKNQLEELVEKALQAPAIALDTEFFWERTFYPILGLVQLAIGRECYLIDPLAIEDLSPLGKLLAEPSLVKILHDAQQDLVILKAATGANPKNIFDSRLAYGFCSSSSTLSLAALLEKTLDIKLTKTETRANWLKRPLTDKMIDYARDDVKYLCEVRDLIVDRAEKQKTLSLLEEDMKKFDSSELYEQIEVSEYFRKIKGVEQLKGQKLAVLRELATWREKTARRKDRPRGHIVPNNVLLSLAFKCPRNIEDLRRNDRLSNKSIQMYGKDLINCIEKGLNTPDELLPTKPCVPSHKKSLGDVLALVEQHAESFNIDPALVCSRKELNMFLDSYENASYEQVAVFDGWRNEFMDRVLANVNATDV